MATRATMTISDEADCFHIYRHYDGYPAGPHGVVKDILAARDQAWPLPRFEAGDYAAALVARMKQRAGSVFLTQNAERHADRDYHYDIRCESQVLHLTVQRYSMRAHALVQEFEGSLEQAANRYEVE